MSWLRTVLAETYGLFVDDGRFALAILLWLAFAGLLLPALPIAAGLKGPLLFLGLAAILAESAIRRARK